MQAESRQIPYIDPNVEHVGVSRLRTLNATVLRNFEKTLVIQDHDKPLAVLLTWEQFLRMQKQLEAVRQTVEVLSDGEETRLLSIGLEEMKAGKTRELSTIRARLKKKHPRVYER